MLRAESRNSSRSSSLVSRQSRRTDEARISLEPNQSAPESQQESQAIPKTGPVDMQHAKLLHHLITGTVDSLRPEAETDGISFHDLFKEVLDAPYVMNEALALAAIHLSTLNPAQQTFYRHQAKELQTHALSILNQISPEVNAVTCVPLLLFSSALGMHEMCEAFFYRESSFEPFLDKFIHYVCLHQGVRAVTSGSWQLLNDSILRPFLLQGAESVAPMGAALDNKCSQLLELIMTANLGEDHRNSCEQAISALQSTLSKSQPGVPNGVSVNTILAWPVVLCKPYIALLRTRDPYSLIILAHFGAVVHLRRDLWILGDGGQFLVRLIAEHLGDEWYRWLTWPVEIVSDQ